MQFWKVTTWAAVASLALGAACGKGDSGGDGDGTETDTEATDDGSEKFDVLDGDTSGGACPDGSGGGGGNMNDYSVIWIANSPEGTVSKIDTISATEVNENFQALADKTVPVLVVKDSVGNTFGTVVGYGSEGSRSAKIFVKFLDSAGGERVVRFPATRGPSDHGGSQNDREKRM